MNKRIKLIHVITDANIGGAGRHLLAYLNEHDHETFLVRVVLPNGSRLIPELRQRNILYTEIPYINARSFSLRAIFVLYSVFRKFKPDIVHTHASFSARIAARLRYRCKIVYTRHSVFPVSKTAQFFLFRFIRRLLAFLFCDRVIAVSPAARDNLRQLGVAPNRIQVIYNGVPEVPPLSEAEKTAIRAKYKIPPGAFVAAHIARMTEVKGHDYILDAVRLLQGCGNIFVLMAGDGPLEAHLRRRLSDEHIENVLLTGFIRDIGEVENIAQVLLNASYGTEATSLALAEGMSLGVPALVSDFGGNPYMVTHEENGLVVPQKDAEALRDALLRLRNDTALYEKLSAGARQAFTARFTVQEMVSRMESLYRRLVGVKD